MPTGSGKSLCYQLPALLRDDLTVVVSPLVALMQDQVEALRARGLGDRAALVNAQQDGAANADAIRRAAAGELRLLYVAPERFAALGFLERLQQARIGLFVVDEAHCVSQWGHDFRPDYFRLADAARALGARALVASTATATPGVAQDVAARLRLRDPVRIATGFDRPNIAFSVARPAGHEKGLITAALREPDALPAIVYAGTRAGAEQAGARRRAGCGRSAYHAGLERDRRAEVQRAFLADEIPLIVATNAFGMGVDKPNVRSVVHASVPASLEAYYQEAGRAGRDGGPRALLVAENRDKALHVHFIKSDEIEDGLPGWLADRFAAAADGDGRYSLRPRARPRPRRWSRPGPLPGRPPHAGGVLSLAVGAGPSRRAPGGPVRQARRPAQPGVDRGGGPRPLAAVPRDLGIRRARLLQARSRAAPFRRPLAPGAAPRRVLRRLRPGPRPGSAGTRAASLESLDDAIVSVARMARPAVGRTTCAEILHGARTQKIKRNSYDGLPAYGISARMRRADILARVDELIDEGRIETSGGPYPVIRCPSALLS